MLRRLWPKAPVSWQSRTGGDGFLTLDPLGDPNGLAKAARQAEVILCLAGVVPPNGELSLNTDLAMAAVRAAASAGGKPVLLSSTAAVYGRGDRVWSEDDPTEPLNPYGVEKLRMEQSALKLGEDLSVPVCCLRIGNVAGADAFLGGATDGFKLHIFDDGTSLRRSYIGPHCFANVLRSILTQVATIPPRLNIALPGAVAVDALMNAAGRPWTPLPAPDTAIPNVELDVTRLKRFHQFEPDCGTAQAVAEDWNRWAQTGDQA